MRLSTICVYLVLMAEATPIVSLCKCKTKEGDSCPNFSDSLCSSFLTCSGSECDNLILTGCDTVTCEANSCQGAEITTTDGGNINCGEGACKDAKLEATIIDCSEPNSCQGGSFGSMCTCTTKEGNPNACDGFSSSLNGDAGSTGTCIMDLCSGGVITGCDEVVCNDNACSNTEIIANRGGTITCSGEDACKGAILLAESGSIQCIERLSCRSATMEASAVACEASNSCTGAAAKTKSIECSGERSCRQKSPRTPNFVSDDIKCSGYLSCHNNWMEANEVRCSGVDSCKGSTITSQCLICDPAEETCTDCTWENGGSNAPINCRAEAVHDKCPIDVKSSAMNGDPHLKSWSNVWFDYHGECDLLYYYVASFLKKGVSLTISVRTKLRRAYSYIEGAAVRIGNDTLEVVSFGDHAYNGVGGATFHGMDLSGYPIKYSNPNAKQHFYDIVIDEKIGTIISITTFKDLVGVQIKNGTKAQFGSGYGIMGSWEGNFLARDGVTILEDKNSFGQEWQVHDDEPMLFRYARAPQFPQESCKLPSPDSTATQRRLGEAKLSAEEAQDACAHLSGEPQKNCEMDVLLIGDADIATSGIY